MLSNIFHCLFSFDASSQTSLFSHDPAASDAHRDEARGHPRVRESQERGGRRQEGSQQGRGSSRRVVFLGGRGGRGGGAEDEARDHPRAHRVRSVQFETRPDAETVNVTLLLFPYYALNKDTCALRLHNATILSSIHILS